MNLSEKEILSKLVLIEQYLKKDSHCFYVPSSTFNTIDVISIQKEATKMLHFVGLNHHIACVTFTNTGEHQGGNIELDHSDNVFIEINRDFRNDINKVLAVMAHEICHKLLYVNGLYLKGEDNEILTDLATVYVGFGKISLNGCYKEYETECDKREDGNTKRIKTKHTETVGYLSLSQFAIAYHIVCVRFRIEYDESSRGLSTFATDALRTNLVSITSPKRIKDLKEMLRELQVIDAKLMNALVLINETLNQIKNSIRQRNLKYREDLVLPFSNQDDEEFASKQMLAIEKCCQYPSGDEQCEWENTIVQNILNSLVKNNKSLYPQLMDSLLTIECPCCGYKKQNAIREYRTYSMKCPQCNYLFLWDANQYEIEVEENEEHKKEQNNKGKNITSLIRRIPQYFKRMKDSSSSRDMTFEANLNDIKSPWINLSLHIIKSLTLLGILALYVYFCVFVDVYWYIKLAIIIPTTIVWKYAARFIPPYNFDNDCEVSGPYEGGNFTYESGWGSCLEGNFGYHSDNRNNNLRNSKYKIPKYDKGVYRAYEFWGALRYLVVPVNCFILTKNSTSEEDLIYEKRIKNGYTIYGRSKWYFWEIVYIYLKKISILAAIILFLFGLGYILESLGIVK